MSLIRIVVERIKEHESACLEEIWQECGGKTKAQVLKALANALQLGLIEKVGLAPKVPGRRAGRQAIYAVTGADHNFIDRPQRERPPPPRGMLGHLGKVSSVFDLGRSAGLGA